MMQAEKFEEVFKMKGGRARTMLPAKRRKKLKPAYHPRPQGVYSEAVVAVECFLMCRNRAESSLVRFPRDLVRLIAKIVYETRYNSLWMRVRAIKMNLDALDDLKKQIQQNPKDEEALERNEMLLEKIESLNAYFDIE